MVVSLYKIEIKNKFFTKKVTKRVVSFPMCNIKVAAKITHNRSCRGRFRDVVFDKPAEFSKRRCCTKLNYLA